MPPNEQQTHLNEKKDLLPLLFVSPAGDWSGQPTHLFRAPSSNLASVTFSSNRPTETSKCRRHPYGFVYYHSQRKCPPPRNYLDIDALRLPTLSRNQAADWLMPSEGRQPQRTDVQVVARERFFCLWLPYYMHPWRFLQDVTLIKGRALFILALRPIHKI